MNKQGFTRKLGKTQTAEDASLHTRVALSAADREEQVVAVVLDVWTTEETPDGSPTLTCTTNGVQLTPVEALKFARELMMQAETIIEQRERKARRS